MSKYSVRISYYSEGSNLTNPVLGTKTHNTRVFADTLEEAIEKVKTFDPKYIGIIACDMEELKNPTK